MGQGQTKTFSLIESTSNILFGYFIAIMVQIIIFPWFGIYVSLKDNIIIAGIFTVVSIFRSYFFRRFFNYLSTKGVGVVNTNKKR